MRYHFTIIAILVGLLAAPALAGDGVWDKSELSPGNFSAITIVGTPPLDTPTIEVRSCSKINIMTPDTDVTFDVDGCLDSGGVGCGQFTSTTIDAASDQWLTIDAPGTYLRLGIVTDASDDATFLLTCHF